jgi:hypothetical protein
VVRGWHRRQQEEATRRFLADIAKTEVLPVDNQIAQLAGRICGDLERTGQPINLADALIAATAMDHALLLICGLRAWDITSSWIINALRSIGEVGVFARCPIKAFERKGENAIIFNNIPFDKLHPQ